MIVGKAENKNSNMTSNVPATKKPVEDDYDFDFDDDLDYNPSAATKPTTTAAAGKSQLPPLTAIGKHQPGLSSSSDNNNRFSYGNDDDFEIEDDQQPIKPVAATKATPAPVVAASSNVDEEYDFEYDEEIEEDIDDAPITDKNTKSTPPAAAAKAPSQLSQATSKPASAAASNLPEPKKVQSNFDYGFDIEDDENEDADEYGEGEQE